MARYTIKYDVKENKDKTVNCTVNWTIHDFEFRVQPHKSNIHTNKADCKDVSAEDTKFLFKIEFFGINFSTFLIYYLAPVPMCLKYSFKDRHNKDIAVKEYFMVQPNKWQFVVEIMPCFTTNESFVVNKDFFLRVHFTINKEIKVDPICGPKTELNRDLENVLKDSIYSDVTIKSTEGVEFKIHKVVMAARSPVLKAHFEHNTVESLTNIIDTQLETEVLKEVLTYIYTDNTPKLREIPEKLLAAADYYQLNRLKHLCEEALFQKLTVDNAIATLELAELHSASNLKKMTLDFIHDGNTRLVIETNGWKELQSAALTKTILEYIFRNGETDC